jgi:integrase
MTKALTATRVESEQAGTARREIPDGLLPGLYLVVQPSGAKSYAVRYRHGGKSRKLTIGAHPALDLATARRVGAKALRSAAEGLDPAGEKQALKDQANRAATELARGKRDLFENVAREFIERHAKKNNREATWRETARILGFRVDKDHELIEAEGDVLPVWRGRRIQDITKRDVIALLDAVADRGSPIMANRVLAAVRKLFNWCLARDVIASSPCVLVEPPAPERSRERILSDAELSRVWKAADAEEAPFGPLVKLLILTGQRLSEVAGMRWEEVDVEAKLWTLPAQRVKNGKEHEVPLSRQAVQILGIMPRIRKSEGYVFTTVRDAPVTAFSRAKSKLDAAIAEGGEPLDHWTFHDLRRTMASGMARLGIQLPVIEKILNHTSGTFRGVVGVYQRHSFADEKRTALNAWSDHVAHLCRRGPRT